MRRRRRRRSDLRPSRRLAPHSYAPGTVGRRRPRRPGKPWRSRPVGPAPSQNARLRLGMGAARRRRDASPRAARSLTAMPEIDLPTVIFALVALFVAYKLRSVLGMRQDSERQSGGLLAPLRRVPAPPTAPVVPPGRGGGPRSAACHGSVEGRRRARSRGLERPRRHRRSRSQLLAASLSFRRTSRLRHGRSCLRRRRFGDAAQSDDAGSVRQFRQRNSQPRGGRPNDDDDRRLDRRRHHRRGATRRRGGATRRAFRRQARLRHSRRPRRRSSMDRQAPSPIISICGLSGATFARAIPTGC